GQRRAGPRGLRARPADPAQPPPRPAVRGPRIPRPRRPPRPLGLPPTSECRIIRAERGPTGATDREETMAINTAFTLDAKYRLQQGVVFLSGIQALVRLPLDQHRADQRRGLNTATLISGYPGSPLGGFDLTLKRNGELLREHQVVFIPGVNEDLGATAVA